MSSSATPTPSSALVLWLIGGLIALAAVAYRAVSSAEIEPVLVPVEYLSDPDGRLALADVISTRAQFQPLTDDSLLPPSGIHWLRFTAANAEPRAADAVIEFANLYVDDVTVYAPSNDVPPGRTGQLVPLAQRSVRSHLPAVRVALPAQGASTVFVRSAGPINEPAPVRLWSSVEDFRRAEQRQVLPLALYFGLWGALLAYNAFVYVVLRERVVLFYLGYLAAVGVLALVGTNFSAYLVPGLGGMARELTIFALLALGCAALVQFSRAFLETATYAPRLDRGLRVLLGLNLAALISLAALGDLNRLVAAGLWLYGVAFVTLVALPLAGVYRWIRGSRQAPLFVLAFACFGAGLGWMILAEIGFVPPDHTNGAPFLLGSALELLLLAIAVAHRYRLIREDRERLQAAYTTQLETDVAARMSELRAANADKDRLISLVAHDVRSPLTSLLAVSRSLARQPERRPPEEIANDARAIQQRCDDLLVLVDNLLDWGRLRTGHLTRDPAALDLGGLVEAALQPLRTAATAKSLTHSVAIPHGLTVFADGYAVQCVIRNLVANAIKFTPPGGRISLVADAQPPARVILRVIDTGVGIAPERLAHLFQPVAATPAGEGGVGVGLVLCRDLVEREGGTLQLASQPGQGTTVTLTLSAVA